MHIFLPHVTSALSPFFPHRKILFVRCHDFFFPFRYFYFLYFYYLLFSLHLFHCTFLKFILLERRNKKAVVLFPKGLRAFHILEINNLMLHEIPHTSLYIDQKRINIKCNFRPSYWNVKDNVCTGSKLVFLLWSFSNIIPSWNIQVLKCSQKSWRSLQGIIFYLMYNEYIDLLYY